MKQSMISAYFIICPCKTWNIRLRRWWHSVAAEWSTALETIPGLEAEFVFTIHGLLVTFYTFYKEINMVGVITLHR